MQSSPSHESYSGHEGDPSYQSQPISISGSGLVEGSKKRLFVPRLNNKYEQSLYEKIEKRSGIQYWNVNQFDKETQGRHLDAVSEAFEQAMKNAGLYRKINKKMSQRIGIVYFNMYGPTSFMNKEFQVKEMYQSDVFPAFLLNNHNITGYSVRLRGERNALFQGLELARTLIQSGQLDIVVVGGVFQTYSYLYLTEMQAALDWLVSGKIKINRSSSEYTLRDSAGFLVVEASNPDEKRQAKLKLDIDELNAYSASKANGVFELPGLKESLKESSKADTQKGRDIEQCYFGLNGRDEIAQLESLLLKDRYPSAKHVNSYKEWGDFVNINGIKVLHEHIHDQVTHKSLLHSMDRDGSAWNLIFTDSHKNKV
ncbi:MAG: hypothetical protein ACJAYF_002015 [Arenicella sp.]|jgi:hypothetical protein